MGKEPQNTEQLRAQAALLLSQARAQSIDISRALSAVNDSGALHSRLAAAAAQISGAISGLSQALGSSSFPLHAADLAAFESIVLSGETSSLLTEANAQATANAARAQNVAVSSSATRQEVQSLSHDIFDKHIFDPYLHFSSKADEDKYRKREAEARRYIDAQLARGTPEGNLNAGGGMIGTMLDAHAHGAGDSPEFMPRWNALVEKTERQRAAMQAAGQSTAEYDRNVKAAVRRFLKDEGHLSDAEIDRRLAASANPLDAVKPFMANDHASRSLERQMERVVLPTDPSQPLPRVETATNVPPSANTLPLNLDAMTAKINGAIVQVSDNTEDGHGLTIQKLPGKTEITVAG